MNLSNVGRGVLRVAMVGMMLAGCASHPKVEPEPIAPPPAAPAAAPTPAAPPPPAFKATPGLDPRERSRKVFELLDAGQPGQARAEAEQLLIDQPDNAQAKSAIEQIDGDPKVMLGEKNFAYEIRPGESLSVLAERYLGDRLKFYVLARYNNISAPNQATVGQTIMIPGAARNIPPVPKPRAEPVDARKAPMAPTPTPADPRKANALRSQALVQMNKGAIDRAVSLLREAIKLDPTNTAISGDLARALRIQAATRH